PRFLDEAVLKLEPTVQWQGSHRSVGEPHDLDPGVRKGRGGKHGDGGVIRRRGPRAQKYEGFRRSAFGGRDPREFPGFRRKRGFELADGTGVTTVFLGELLHP